MVSPKPRFGGGKSMKMETNNICMSVSQCDDVTDGDTSFEITQKIPTESYGHCSQLNLDLQFESGQNDGQWKDCILENNNKSEILSRPEILKNQEALTKSEINKITEHLILRSPQKKDIQKLINVLESLGIYVLIHPYAQSSSVIINKTNSFKNYETEIKQEESQNKRLLCVTLPPSLSPDFETNWFEAGNKMHHIQGNNSTRDVLYSKNLFLKDRKGRYYLVIAEENASVDLKLLKQQLNAARNLSFADATATESILGSKSGDVNPFVAMRESTRDVKFVIHQSLMKSHLINVPLAFHPFDGKLQVNITIEQLRVFLHNCSQNIEILKSSSNNSTVENHFVEGSASQKNDSKKTKKNIIDQDIKDDKACFVSEKINLLHMKNNIDLQKSSETNSAKSIDVLFKYEHSTNSTGSPKANTGNSSMQKATKTNLYHKDMMSPLIHGKPVWKVFDRKGKLKSFLKKNEGTEDSDGNASSTNPTAELNARKSMDGACNLKEEADQFFDRDNCGTLQTECNQMQPDVRIQYNSKEKVDSVEHSILPDITKFYNRLLQIGIEYKDIDLHTSTSRDIGPSLGCKCFVLKDRRQHVFLVITHEYYELDHGRLKKALKPQKKLDVMEPTDILEILGVDPCRVSPFAVTTDRARANNVQVFMTEKIRSHEVVLCIKHPFGESHRLVMTSQNLQRYLLEFVPEVGTVQEKAWPERFNQIFTRFADQTVKNLIVPKEDDQDIEISVSDATSCSGERNLKDQVRHTLEDNMSNPLSFKTMPLVKFIFNFPRNITHYIQLLLCKESVFHENSFLDETDGTSVDHDPAFSLVVSNENLDKVNHSNADNSSFLKSHEVIHSLKEFIPNRNNDRSKHFNTTIMNSTVHDILQHLQEIDIEFTVVNHRKKSIDYSGSFEIVHEGDSPIQDRDIEVEVCRTSVVYDEQGTTYLIVGGESDFITIKRFRRRFHLSGKLNVCKIAKGDMKTTPFSFSQSLKIPNTVSFSSSSSTSPSASASTTSSSSSSPPLSFSGEECSKICVVLFSTIYIDSDTICEFDLHKNGPAVQLSSGQLEDYAKKTGFQLWYMP